MGSSDFATIELMFRSRQTGSKLLLQSSAEKTKKPVFLPKETIFSLSARSKLSCVWVGELLALSLSLLLLLLSLLFLLASALSFVSFASSFSSCSSVFSLVLCSLDCTFVSFSLDFVFALFSPVFNSFCSVFSFELLFASAFEVAPFSFSFEALSRFDFCLELWKMICCMMNSSCSESTIGVWLTNPVSLWLILALVYWGEMIAFATFLKKGEFG